MVQQFVLPEEELARKASTIRLFSLGLLITAGLAEIFAIIIWLLAPLFPIVPLTTVLMTVMLISPITYLIVRAGHIRAAGYFFIISLTLESAILTPLIGGFTGPMAVTYLFSILIAGMVININSGFLIATLAAALYLIMIPVEQANLLPQLFAPQAERAEIPYLTVTSRVVLFYLVAFLSWFGTNRLNRTLQSTRKYAAQLQTTNEKLQASEESLRISYKEIQAIEEELRTSNERLEIANEELKKATQAKSEFLTGMSHELRTPLNIIIGFSELMMNKVPGEINDEQRQCLDDILSSGKHLLNLINEVLDLARIESGKMKLRPTTFALLKVMESLQGTMKPMLTPRKQSLDVSVKTGLPLVHTDKAKVKQVLLNLLSNSIKYTPHGGKLKIEAIIDDGWCQVSVVDNGIGIKEEDQDRIFEPFCQLGSSLTVEKSGTGLGLTLAKQIIEILGGRIWVESEYGKGSRFIFTLPLATTIKHKLRRAASDT